MGGTFATRSMGGVTSAWRAMGEKNVEGACMDLYGERAGLGAPNTYYQLNSTTPENPVKCKYCGLRFYGVH